MSTLVDHARRELELCGQTAEDPAYAQALIAAVAVFDSVGHSGASAEVAAEQLARLLRYENLSPLTDDPDEWIDRSDISGAPIWQSARNPAAFSDNAGRTYYLVTEHPAGTRYPCRPTTPSTSTGSEENDNRGLRDAGHRDTGR